MKLRERLIRLLGGDVLSSVAAEAAQSALREAAVQIDPDDHLYRDLGGLTRRGLPSHTHDRAQDIAFTLYQQNALGHRLTELLPDFIVGDGITWSSTQPDVQDVVQDWWEDDVNSFDQRQHDFALELGLYGELFPEALTGDVSGVMQLGYIDCGNVKRVELDPKNPLVADKVVVKVKQDEKTLDVIRDRGDGILTGNVFYFRVNSVSNAPRGWPDLLHIADWLDAYDQLLWEMVERASLARAFIWDVEIEGDEAYVEAWVKKHGTSPPRSGSVRAHNEKIKWSAVAPQLGSHEIAKEAETQLEHIATGAGLPKHWLNASADVNRACYSEDTQTLTERGWRSYWDIEPGEKIATFNPETGHLEFAEPLGFYLYDFAGEMVRFHSAGVDVLVTPEHRMWTGYDRWSYPLRWELTPAQEITNQRFTFADRVAWEEPEQDIFVLPGLEPNPEAHGQHRGHVAERVIAMDLWLEFLGYVISEGCIFEPGEQSAARGQYRVSLSQSERVNPEKAAVIGACLQAMPVEFGSYSDKDGTRRWQVSDKGLWTWLHHEVGRFSGDKRIPRAFMGLGKRQLEILFEALMLGDGTSDVRQRRTARSYSTKSPQLADDVQEIALRLGYRARIRQATRVLSVELQPARGHVLTQQNVSREPYEGAVYCFEVPNHLFVTRRAGKVAIHGNTAVEQSAPTTRRLARRQRYFLGTVRRMLRYVVEQACQSGRISNDDGLVDEVDAAGTRTGEKVQAWRTVKLHAPEISPRDSYRAGQLLLQLTQGLATAEEKGWFGADTSRRAIAAALAQMGVDIGAQGNPAEPVPQEPAGHETEDAKVASIRRG